MPLKGIIRRPELDAFAALTLCIATIELALAAVLMLLALNWLSYCNAVVLFGICK
jgi:hypothetical protein